ncbi:MAG TPA: adenosine deaminase [Candidatus Baltobacteraceae bacterium]|nr:adenosine deaminase [Candidatus Baltobacteraceae bacterium]
MRPIDPAIASLPKIHLHCHLEGSLRAETFVELARRYGVSTRFNPRGEELAGPTDPALVYRYANFQEFLLTFAAVSRALATPDDYARLAREFVADALAQNVVYGELFVSPSVWAFFHPELDIAATIRSVVAELRAARVRDVDFKLIVDVTRNFGADSAMRTAQIAASLAGEGVIGIGLGGDEARFPPALFEDVFAFARANGLRGVAHAGEAAGAQSVRDAIELLGAERIGHGIRALEDPRVVELLRERAIPLEVNPTSNYATGVVGRDDAHPLAELDAQGLAIVIDADDPAMFETSISADYAYVAETLGIDALRRFIASAVEAAFLSDAEKRALFGRVGMEPIDRVAKP